MIGKISMIEWIVDAPDGKTSTIKYTDGTKITISKKEAHKIAVMANKEKKARDRKYGITK